VHPAVLVDEGPPEDRVVTPTEIDLLPPLVYESFVNSQNAFVATETYGFNQVKRRSYGTNIETNLDLIRVIFGDVVPPRKKRNLTVLA
jgi:hypothetical protein